MWLQTFQQLVPRSKPLWPGLLLLGVMVVTVNGVAEAAPQNDGWQYGDTVAAPNAAAAANEGALQAGGFSGSLGYSIQLATPPGRSGSAPGLGLGYSSDGQNSWCGVGWSLGFGAISRDTKDGVPVLWDPSGAVINAFDDAVGYRFGGIKLIEDGPTAGTFRQELDPGGAYLRFEIAGDGWCVTDKSGTKRYYGENAQSRLENLDWTVGMGGPTTTRNRTASWLLSRSVDATGNEVLYTYWKDVVTHGQHTGVGIYPATIEYNGNVNTGFSHTHTVTFELEDREFSPGDHDNFVSFRSGIRSETNYRLKRVVFAASGNTLHSYEFTYAKSGSTGHTLLTSSQKFGSDGTTSLPAQTFEYTEQDFEFEDPQSWGHMLHQDVGGGVFETELLRSWNSIRSTTDKNNTAGADTERTNLEFMDFNRDGRPDRVLADRTVGPDKYLVQHANRMGGLDQQLVDYSFDLPIYSPITRASLGWTSVDVGGILAGMVRMQVMDINGDGFVDRVHDPRFTRQHQLPNPDPGPGFDDHFTVELGNGTGFDPRSLYGPIDRWGEHWNIPDNAPGYTDPMEDGLPGTPGHKVAELAVTLRDMNGDGRPDRVMRPPGNLVHTGMNGLTRDFFRVQINTGTGFGAPQDWKWDERYTGTYPANSEQYFNNISTYDSGSNPWLSHNITAVDLFDINGDGLPDRIHREKQDLNNLTSAKWMVQYNMGYRFTKAELWGTLLPAGIVPTAGWYSGMEDNARQLLVVSAAGGIGTRPKVSILRDINADGLVDRVMYKELAFKGGIGPEAPYVFSFQLNTGHGFGPIREYTGVDMDMVGNTPPVGESLFPAASMVLNENQLISNNVRASLEDVNADGLPDRVFAKWVAPLTDSLTVQLAKGTRPDLLKVIRNGQGGRHEFEFGMSTDYDNTDGVTSIGQSRTIRPVVTKQTSFDGVNILGGVTTFEYDGAFYDFDRREDAGFFMVKETDPIGVETTTYFHQGAGSKAGVGLGELADHFSLRGTPFHVEVRGSDQKLYSQQWSLALWFPYFATVGGVLTGEERFFSYIPRSATETTAHEGASSRSVLQVFETAYDPINHNKTLDIDHGEVASFDPLTYLFGAPVPDIHGDVVQSRTNTFYVTVGNPDIQSLVGAIVQKPSAADVGTFYSSTTFQYNLDGTVKEKRSFFSGFESLLEKYEYDSFGMLNAVVGPDGTRTEVMYEPTYHLFAAETRLDPGGLDHMTATSFDVATVQMVSETDAAGLTSTLTLDPLHRPLEVGATAGGIYVWGTRWTYMIADIANGGVGSSGIKIETNDALGGVDTVHYYDGAGQTIQTRYEGESGEYRVVDQQYDPVGRPIFTSQRYLGTGGAYTAPSGQIGGTTEYGPIGRVFRMIPPVGDLGAPSAPVTLKHNDEDLWPFAQQVTGATANTTIERYDVRGRITRVIEGDVGERATMLFKHDLNDRITSKVDALGVQWSATYDLLGRELTSVDPNSGASVRSYDAAGRLKRLDTARGTAIEFDYDAAGRVVESRCYDEFGAIDDTLGYEYDSSPNPLHSVSKGQLSRVNDGEGWLRYGYDDFGRVVRKTRHYAKLNRRLAMAWDYNEIGDIETVVYPRRALTLSYTYFKSGALRQVFAEHGLSSEASKVLFKADSYDKDGFLTGCEFGNGTQSKFLRYANSRRIRKLWTKAPSGIVQDLEYEYDAAGLLTNISDGLPGGHGEFVGIQYDSLQRLKSYSANGQASLFSYDSGGNITSSDETGAGAYSYSAFQPHAVVSAAGQIRAYDANGNVTGRAWQGIQQTLNYDSCDRLSSVVSALGTVSFAYGGNGSRLWRESSSSLSVYFDDDFELEGDQAVCHVRAGMLRVCSVERDLSTSTLGLPVYAIQNHLGSNSLNLDHLGVVTQRTTEMAYGQDRFVLNSAGYEPAFRFTDKRFDLDTGLYYMGKRYYDPYIGRFIQPDPSIVNLYDSQAHNGYSYARNNPLRFVDPTGAEFSVAGFLAVIQGAQYVSAKIDAVTTAVSDVRDTIIGIPDTVAAVKEAFDGPAGPMLKAFAKNQALGAGEGYGAEFLSEVQPVIALRQAAEGNPKMALQFAGEFLGLETDLRHWDEEFLAASGRANPGPFGVDGGRSRESARAVGRTAFVISVVVISSLVPFGGAAAGGTKATITAARGSGVVRGLLSRFSSRRLGRALKNAADGVRPKGVDAHHIVAGGARAAARSRVILRRFGIGLDEAVNGVFLPRAFHRGVHTGNYYRSVERLLRRASPGGRDAVLGALERVARRLTSGRGY